MNREEYGGGKHEESEKIITERKKELSSHLSLVGIK